MKNASHGTLFFSIRQFVDCLLLWVKLFYNLSKSCICVLTWNKLVIPLLRQRFSWCFSYLSTWLRTTRDEHVRQQKERAPVRVILDDPRFRSRLRSFFRVKNAFTFAFIFAFILRHLLSSILIFFPSFFTKKSFLTTQFDWVWGA